MLPTGHFGGRKMVGITTDLGTDDAEYVGPIVELQGKRALVRPDATYDEPDCTKRTLLAQFYDAGAKHPETNEQLCYGWHTFPVMHFFLLVRV